MRERVVVPLWLGVTRNQVTEQLAIAARRLHRCQRSPQTYFQALALLQTDVFNQL
jgi:hypothetical protein